MQSKTSPKAGDVSKKGKGVLGNQPSPKKMGGKSPLKDSDPEFSKNFLNLSVNQSYSVIDNQEHQPKDEIVNLNIGGTHKIATGMKILTCCEESKLTKVLRDKDNLMMSGNEILLDRDGPTFVYLLNYLRNDRKEVPIFESTRDEHLFYREL